MNELKSSLKHMKNIKIEETSLLRLLSKLFNACLRNYIILMKWKKTVVALIHKKGYIAMIQNFRPLTLLAQ